jgi:ubiquinone/menaquinone biosynthesis C-methylase UbiE
VRDALRGNGVTARIRLEAAMDQAANVEGAPMSQTDWPGPADVAYQTEAQAGGFGQTLASFVNWLGLPPGASVLDVGTGPGLMVRLVAGPSRFVVGCDNSSEMLAQARGLLEPGSAHGVSWAQADACRLPFGSMAFSASVATNLLFLLPDPFAAVCELARVVRYAGAVGWLNPSDRLCRASAAAFADSRGLTGFARFSMINYGRIAEQHHRLSAEQWADLAARAGLHDIAVESRAGGLMTIVKGRKATDA